jgi:hypothetical protein
MDARQAVYLLFRITTAPSVAINRISAVLASCQTVPHWCMAPNCRATGAWHQIAESIFQIGFAMNEFPNPSRSRLGCCHPTPAQWP